MATVKEALNLTQEDKERFARLVNEAVQIKEERDAGVSEPIEMTEAQRRIARAKAQSGPKVERHEIEGEEWFLGRLDYPSSHLVSFYTPRNEKGGIDLQDYNTLRNYTAALLYCATFEDESGKVRFFGSHDEALAYVDLPSTGNVVAHLYLKLVEMNTITAPKKTEMVTSTPDNGS